MAIAAANLLCGMIIMQLCNKKYQIWPTNCAEILDEQGFIIQSKFELSRLKKIANLLPKTLQAALFLPGFGVEMAGMPNKYNLLGRCFEFIDKHLVFKFTP